jgi:hypothetical protein
MDKTIVKSIVLPSLVILVGGFVVLGLGWLSYVGIYLWFETTFYPFDPLSGSGRSPSNHRYAVDDGIIGIVYLFKVPTLVKATLLVPAMGTFLITMVLSFYTHITFVIIMISLVVIMGCVIIARFRFSWYYYLALGYATVLAIVYAWPR